MTRSMHSRFVPLLLAHAAEHGIDATALADRHSIPLSHRSLERWSVDAGPVAVSAVDALSRELAAKTGDAMLGATVGASLRRGSYGVAEFAGRNATTLRGAAERLVRYRRLINDAISCRLDEQGDFVVLEHRFEGLPGGFMHGNLFTVCALHKYFSELLGSTPRIERVELAHQGGREAKRLRQVFATPQVLFGTGRNALWFAAGELDRNIQAADPELLRILDDTATRLVPEGSPTELWPDKVRTYLRRTLCDASPTINQAAAALGTSRRNLQRRLEEAGLTFSDLLEQVREQQARHLLVASELPVKTIAVGLGYSSSRAFIRAFKRWTGLSPAAYRAGGQALPRAEQ